MNPEHLCPKRFHLKDSRHSCSTSTVAGSRVPL